MTRQEDFSAYIKPFFTLESYKKTYAGAIIHPYNADFAEPLQFELETSEDESEESETDVMLPPNTKRAPGRPKKRRIRTRTEKSDDAPLRVQKYTRC